MKLVIITFLFFTLIFGQNNHLIEYVNPFIGTSNGGNTFPGAVVPWGMVSVSPHNAPGSPSGYLYGSPYLFGFGQTHLSGTGCSDLGSIIITATNKVIEANPEKYKTKYSKEFASPGYYSVFLDNFKIKAEVTSTIRCGMLKFSTTNNEPINILIDAGRSLNLVGGGSIKIVNNNTIEGSNISGGFCGELNRQTVYFSAEINQQVDDLGVWIGDSLMKKNEIHLQDTSLGCWLKIKNPVNKEVIIKIGLSYVSIENARINLKEEIKDWNFEQIKNNAQSKWQKELSRIIVDDTNKENKIKFYSSVYHMLIHPNIISDINGEYPKMEKKGIGKYEGRERYSTFSLWDTYRTLHPFLTLVYPEVQSDIIKTMLDMYKENGALPKWELTGSETYMMVGDGAAITISDSYVKGIKDFDDSIAFEALTKPILLNEGETAHPVRAGYHQLLKYKYIPFEQDMNDNWWVWGPVSTTLEYNLADFAISRFAKIYGKTELSNKLYERSLWYKNLFDKSTLFMRPKMLNGNWKEPFDSLATEGSGDWIGSGGPGFVEGNAWNYTWFVPHDVEGLIYLFGSEDAFYNKLIRAFKEKHFTINNEPDIAYPYLFTYINGKEEETKKIVKDIMNNDFGIDHNGLPGNDDCGAISGWFAFSALGFYPSCPADDFYIIGDPIFNKVTIKLNSKYFTGKEVTIIKEKESYKKVYLNNKEVKEYKLKHSDLVDGSNLIFR